MHTDTTWYTVKGVLKEINYPISTNGSQFYAGFEYYDQYIHEILRTEQTFFVKPVEITDSNIIVEEHKMNRGYYMEKMISSVSNLELRRAEIYVKSTYGADVVDIKIKTYFNEAEIELKEYHIYKYKYNDHYYHKFINGNTGEMSGKSIYSIEKLALTGALSGALATIGLVSIVYPPLKVAYLGLYALTGSAFGGICVSGIANVYFKYKNKYISEHIDNEYLTNFKYSRKYETKQNTNTAKNSYTKQNINTDKNSDTKQNDTNQYNIPASKLKLLNIHPDEKITAEFVKRKYYSELKKWHPDLYRGNPEVGKLMTQQINEAYKYIINKL